MSGKCVVAPRRIVVPDQSNLPEGVERYAFYRDVETGDGEWRELTDANAAAVPGREVIEFIDLRRDLPKIIEQARQEEREKVQALYEHACGVEEFLRQVTEWKGCAEDELAEAIEDAEKLTAALDPDTPEGGSE